MVITWHIEGSGVFSTGGGKSLVCRVSTLAFNDYDELGDWRLVVDALIAWIKVCSTPSPMSISILSNLLSLFYILC